MKKRTAMILAFAFLWIGMAMAQTEISGVIVFQDDGEPVIGATVRLKGSKTGVVSDIDGRFKLNAPKGSQITVSYVGMETQTLKGSTNMKITLKSDSHMIDEVVVTGMQKMDKRLFTGATTKIDAEKTKLAAQRIKDAIKAL